MDSVNLQLSSEKMRNDQIQSLTRDLFLTLSKQKSIKPKMPEGISVPGKKGEPITIGLLVLTFITSGAAVALLEVIKAYLIREKSLKITIKKTDGTGITLNAQNINDEQIRDTLNQLVGR